MTPNTLKISNILLSYIRIRAMARVLSRFSVFIICIEILESNWEDKHISNWSLISLFCFNLEYDIHPTWNWYSYFFVEKSFTLLCDMCQRGTQALILRMRQRGIRVTTFPFIIWWHIGWLIYLPLNLEIVIVHEIIIDALRLGPRARLHTHIPTYESL